MEGTYKVLELMKFGGNISLKERPFRHLEKGEILVKVMATTMHPADLSFISGQYGEVLPDVFPIVPGFEGSGQIVKVAEDIDLSLVNKRMSFFANSSKKGSFTGTWAQYFYTTPDQGIIFNSDISYDTIAFTFGNPMTVCGFYDIIQKKKVKAIVQNGASSAFGKMFIKFCKAYGIKTINLVRRKDHIKPLTEMGADYVLDTSSSNWEEELRKLAKELEATVCFECVGGDITGRVFSCLPEDSTMYHFGNLALKRLSDLDNLDFLLKGKKFEGFWLMRWMLSIPEDQKKYWFKVVVDNLENGSDIFLTKFSNDFPLEEFEKGFEYYLTNMSEGKIIMRPN